MRKDLDLAVTTGEARSVTLTVAAAAREMYERMADAGLSEHDFSAVFKIIPRKAT